MSILDLKYRVVIILLSSIFRSVYWQSKRLTTQYNTIIPSQILIVKIVFIYIAILGKVLYNVFGIQQIFYRERRWI